MSASRRRLRIAMFAVALSLAVSAHGTSDLAADDLAREGRVAALAYRLASRAADAGLCAKPRPVTGMVLHDIAAYEPADRARVRSALKLGTGFGVRLVVPGSPAAVAGIRAGDEVTIVDDRPMADFALDRIGDEASPARTERFASMLELSLSKGSVRLTTQRPSPAVMLLLEHTLMGRPGCGGEVVVTSSRDVNGWSDGKRVAVTSALVDTAPDDAVLAFVVAHEMAHNILSHAARTGGASVAASLGLDGGRSRRAEIEADTLGIRILKAAGYDPMGGERFVAWAAREGHSRFSFTHPSTGKRVDALRAAVSTGD
ncbi:M48 family metalloprotease [Sphingomonas sp. Y38-1Y]|uniref:M48 family metalloprotease n=1 Tax=Sphingomonas sp. Y38-1Y TaxID=3078265 RepID=UPI0028E8B181|nr:M48 family metalloprotease [Sphingomonas sp. Y38-1Y]